MAPVQTSVENTPGRGQAGQLANMTQPKNSFSAVADADIPFGSLVVVDAAGVATVVASAGDITNAKLRKGIAVRRHHAEQNVGAPDRYIDGQSVEVLTKGAIYVPLAADLAVGNQIHVGFQNDEEGQFAGANSADRDLLPVAGATVSEGGTAAGDALAVLDINLP